jgi:predicted transcriptional regulator
MSNPKGNIQSLKPYESKWRSGKTQTIRVPVALAEQILALARKMDSDEPLVSEDVIAKELLALKAKIEAKETGYRANSASELISALKVVFDKL